VVWCASQWKKVEQQSEFYLNVPVFYNSYELKLDKKHRLFIPTDIRRLIDPEVHGKAFFVILGRNRRPWLYPEKYYQTLVLEMPSEMTPDDELVEYLRLKLSLADRIEWDEQGRVVMPERILRRSGIENDVTLTGVWDHLELWNREAWNTYSDHLVDNSPEIETKGKQAMKAARNSR